MRGSRFYRVLVFVAFFLFLSASDGEIKERTKALEEAINRGDAKAVASFWAEEGIYVISDSQEEISGRAAIESAFDAIFKEKKDLHVEMRVDRVEFPKEDEAQETGVAVLSGGREVAFKIHYLKRGGVWQITNMSEVSFEKAPSNYEKLSALDWLIGEWIDSGSDVEIKTETSWDKYKNFLTQHFVISAQGKFVLEGKQIIGWDPIKKEIRSWMFDSDGTFGEARWQQHEKSWVVTTRQTLSDGKLASSVNIYTPIDQDSYTWQSQGRMIGSDLLPNIDPVTVKRVQVK